MVTHRRCSSALVLACAIAFLAFAAACDKVPLLAPTGSVITLFATSTTVPVNGEIEIIATVIENGTAPAPPSNGNGTTTTSTSGSGTPVQNGTLVSFTTTIGIIEPREARTHNGEVRVKFRGNGQNGTATITAYSGGASSKLENLLVGSAAAKRVTVTANPQSLPAQGGNTQVIARVEDDAGSGVAGVPVAFSTSAGTVSPTTTTTDPSGVATTVLTAGQEATVTATAGAQNGTVTVKLTPRLIDAFTADPQATSAGVPVKFTITPGQNANVHSAEINFGDGTQPLALGSFGQATTASHAYSRTGTYTATVTARDATGATQTQSTSVAVGALPVTLTASPTSATVGAAVTFTVGGVAAGAQVREYRWTFDDGRSFTTGGGVITQSFDTRGQKVVRVDVIGLDGRNLGSAETRINVT